MGLGNFMHLLGGKPKGAKPPAKAAPKGAAKKAEVPPEEEAATPEEDEAADPEEGGDGEGEDTPPPEDEGEGVDDGEEDQAALIAKARREAVAAERRRCAKIFGDKSAANNIAQACQLAFGTNLSADRIIAIMGTATPARGGGLAAAMGSVTVPVVRGGGSAGGGKGTDSDAAAAMLATMRKAGMLPQEGK